MHGREWKLRAKETEENIGTQKQREKYDIHVLVRWIEKFSILYVCIVEEDQTYLKYLFKGEWEGEEREKVRRESC